MTETFELEPVLQRSPPGDRWRYSDAKMGQQIFPNLMDGLESIFQKTGYTRYFIDARAGLVYTIDTIEPEPEIEPEPTKYSIYGE